MSEDPQTRDAETQPDPLVVVGRFIRDPSNASVITAIATVAIFLSGLVYTIVSFKQWQANEKAANAADSAAKTARDSLILANRPWIKIVSVTTRDLPGPQPAAMTFQKCGPKCTWADLIVSVSIENIGPSVAVNTNIELMPLIPDLAQHDWGKDMLATETAFCANAKKRGTEQDSGAVTIFPRDDPFERHWTLSFAIDPKRIQHPPAPWATTNQAGWMPLSVGGCITYQSAVSKEVFQTGFIYDLEGRAKGINGFLGAIPLGSDIPSKDLHFDRNEAGYFAQ